MKRTQHVRISKTNHNLTGTLMGISLVIQRLSIALLAVIIVIKVGVQCLR